jgi:hypothetical protein
VGPRVCLEVSEKRKISCCCWEPNHVSLVAQLSRYVTPYPQIAVSGLVSSWPVQSGLFPWGFRTKITYFFVYPEACYLSGITQSFLFE